MTIADAIYWLKNLAVLSTEKEIPHIEEALSMAIKALEEAEQTEPITSGVVWSNGDILKYRTTSASTEQTEPSTEEVLMGERDCETCKHDTDGGKGCWKCLAREEYNYEPITNCDTDCSWK